MLEKEYAEILRSVLDGLDLGIYVVDRDCRICFWNGGAERITGYSRADVLGRASEDVLHHCGLEPGNSGEGSALRATLDDGEARRRTTSIEHKDGHRIFANIRTAVVRSALGQIIGGMESLGGIPEGHSAVGPREINRDAARPSEEARRREQIRQSLAEMCGRGKQEHLRFGVLKIHVDQLENLQKTHGQEAATKLRKLIVETLGSALGGWSSAPTSRLSRALC